MVLCEWQIGCPDVSYEIYNYPRQLIDDVPCKQYSKNTHYALKTVGSLSSTHNVLCMWTLSKKDKGNQKSGQNKHYISATDH